MKHEILRLKKKHSNRHDLEYWLSKTPEERIEAMEILRKQWYKMNNERPKRLRRVIRIIKPKKG